LIEKILWEHRHGYQPRRIIDGFKLKERERHAVRKVRDRIIHGLNECHVVLAPGSVYDEIINTVDNRSINIEPITLKMLKEYNEEAYNELLDKVFSGRTWIVATAYSHPIQPLMRSDNRDNFLINLYWSWSFFFELFYKYILDKTSPPIVGWWMPECAYTKEAMEDTYKVANEVAKEYGFNDIYLILFLDDRQVKRKGVSIGFIKDRVIVAIRDSALSNAIAFNSILADILCIFKDKLCNVDSPIGEMNDAECYGGNYDPNKPIILEYLYRILEDGVRCSDGKIVRIKMKKIIGIVLEKLDRLNVVDVYDNTSWSDYVPTLDPNLKGSWDTALISKGIFFPRWTGIDYIEDGVVKTYYLIYRQKIGDRIQLRIVNSAWKVAFNVIRKELSNKVYEIVVDYLDRVRGGSKLLREYWRVLLIGEDEEKLIRIHLGDVDLDVYSGLLKAYSRVCQDSYISCPTFWWSIENELVETSLSLIAGGTVLLINTLFKAGDNRWKNILKAYREILLNFDKSSFWAKFKKCIDLQLNLLWDYIERKSRVNTNFLSRIDPTDDYEVNLVARMLYNMAFRDAGHPVYEGDINVHLVKLKILEARGEGYSHLAKRAIAFEWNKSINPMFGEKNIVVRIAEKHYRYLEVS